MVETNLGRAEQYIQDDLLDEARGKAQKALQEVQEGSGTGSEWLGWQKLLDDPNDAVIEQLDQLAAAVREDADVFIVCGIGGSYLGARAVIEALTPFFNGSGPEIIYAGYQMSGRYLSELLEYLEKPNKEGEAKSVYCNVISKSGSTLETALSFRKVRGWMQQAYPDNFSDRIICTTGSEGGALNELIDEYGFGKLIIPDSVGGRFSVLTPVGLFPIAVAGIDIHSLFYGAVSEYDRLKSHPDDIVDYASAKFALHEQGKNVDLLTSFNPQLKGMTKWLQQLLGESEGKEGKGMLPVAAGYSTDLHSLGQFVQQGSKDLMETFIKVENSQEQFRVDESPQNYDGLNYLAGRSFHDINNRAFEGTLQAHAMDEVPCVVIKIKELNALNIGAFIYFYELLTAVYCYCLEVNPFNQPGVENYKQQMYKLLGKDSE